MQRHMRGMRKSLELQRRDDQVIAESKRALELDPLSLIISDGWGHRLHRVRRYDEATSSLNQALERDPHFFQRTGVLYGPGRQRQGVCLAGKSNRVPRLLDQFSECRADA